MDSTGSSAHDWDALARYLAGESSPGERAEIERVLAEDPAVHKLVSEVERATLSIRSEIRAGLDIEAALTRVKARPEFSGIVPITAAGRKGIADTAARKWRVPMPALAAAALLAVGVASWMAYRNRPQESASTASARMLATGVGVRDSIILSDGTKVVIGPLSSVRISADYGAPARQVAVTGDAWFEVAHDDLRPFTVRAGNAAITDVGTKFAVRTDDLTGVSVSVTEGAVSLHQVNTPAQQGVILKAGDNASIETGGHVVTRRGTVTADDVAWLHGKLVFREAPIGEVVTSMKKWYGIEMKVEDPSLVDQHLTATFAGEPADRVLEIIRLALGADIERHGDTAIVRSTKGSMRSR